MHVERGAKETKNNTRSFHYSDPNPRHKVQQGKPGVWSPQPSPTVQKLLSITHLIFIWTAETKTKESDWHQAPLSDPSWTFTKRSSSHMVREKLPVTPGLPRSCDQTPSLFGSSPTQHHHPQLHEPKCPNPSA